MPEYDSLHLISVLPAMDVESEEHISVGTTQVAAFVIVSLPRINSPDSASKSQITSCVGFISTDNGKASTRRDLMIDPIKR